MVSTGFQLTERSSILTYFCGSKYSWWCSSVSLFGQSLVDSLKHETVMGIYVSPIQTPASGHCMCLLCTIAFTSRRKFHLATFCGYLAHWKSLSTSPPQQKPQSHSICHYCVTHKSSKPHLCLFFPLTTPFFFSFISLVSPNNRYFHTLAWAHFLPGGCATLLSHLLGTFETKTRQCVCLFPLFATPGRAASDGYVRSYTSDVSRKRRNILGGGMCGGPGWAGKSAVVSATRLRV